MSFQRCIMTVLVLLSAIAMVWGADVDSELVYTARSEILDTLNGRLQILKRDSILPATPNPSPELAVAQNRMLQEYFLFADAEQSDLMKQAGKELDEVLPDKLASHTFNPTQVIEDEMVRVLQQYPQDYQKALDGFWNERSAELEELMTVSTAQPNRNPDMLPFGIVALAGLILIGGLMLSLSGLIVRPGDSASVWLRGAEGVVNLCLVLLSYTVAAVMITASFLGGLDNLVWYLGVYLTALVLLLVYKLLVSRSGSVRIEASTPPPDKKVSSTTRRRDTSATTASTVMPKSKGRSRRSKSERSDGERDADSAKDSRKKRTESSSSTRTSSKPRRSSRTKDTERRKGSSDTKREDRTKEASQADTKRLKEEQLAEARIAEALSPPPGFTSDLDRLSEPGETLDEKLGLMESVALSDEIQKLLLADETISADEGKGDSVTVTPKKRTTRSKRSTPKRKADSEVSDEPTKDASSPSEDVPADKGDTVSVTPKKRATRSSRSSPKRKADSEASDEPTKDASSPSEDVPADKGDAGDTGATPAKTAPDFSEIFGASKKRESTDGQTSSRPGRRRKKRS